MHIRRINLRSGVNLKLGDSESNISLSSRRIKRIISNSDEANADITEMGFFDTMFSNIQTKVFGKESKKKKLMELGAQIQSSALKGVSSAQHKLDIFKYLQENVALNEQHKFKCRICESSGEIEFIIDLGYRKLIMGSDIITNVKEFIQYKELNNNGVMCHVISNDSRQLREYCDRVNRYVKLELKVPESNEFSKTVVLDYNNQAVRDQIKKDGVDRAFDWHNCTSNVNGISNFMDYIKDVANKIVSGVTTTFVEKSVAAISNQTLYVPGVKAMLVVADQDGIMVAEIPNSRHRKSCNIEMSRDRKQCKVKIDTVTECQFLTRDHHYSYQSDIYTKLEFWISEQDNNKILVKLHRLEIQPSSFIIYI